MDNEDKRKGIHIINGLWVFVLPFFPRIIAITLVSIAFLFVFILARPHSPFGSLFRESFESMARIEDRERGFLVGPTLYVIMVLVMVLLIDYRIAGAIFAILAFGDGFATVFGRRIGRHKLNNGKSIEGSMAFFTFSVISSIIVFLLINQFNTPGAGLILLPNLMLPRNLNISLILEIFVFLIVSSILTLIELFSTDFINDNIIIPISGSILLYLSFYLLLIFQLHV